MIENFHWSQARLRVRYRLSDITDFEEDSIRSGASERASARNDWK
jgi:hypothetical protein